MCRLLVSARWHGTCVVIRVSQKIRLDLVEGRGDGSSCRLGAPGGDGFGHGLVMAT